jgi:hypothetical protein
MAAPTAVTSTVYNPAGKKRKKLTGKKKAAFLRRMARGRNKAAAKNHRPRKRNLDMFEDSRGYIHPIRGSKGYKKSKTTNRYSGKKKSNRKKKKTPPVSRPRSSNPGVLTIMAQPRKKYSGKKKSNKRRASNRPRYSGKKNRNRKRRNGGHVHRNPTNVFAGKRVWDAIKQTAEVTGGFLATAIIPEQFFTSYNQGATGFGMKAAIAIGGGYGLGYLLKADDGWMFLIGGLVEIVNTAFEEIAGTPIVDLQSFQQLLASGATPAAALAAATTSTSAVAAATGLPASSTGMSGISQMRWRMGNKRMAGSFEAASFPVPQGQPWPGQPFPALAAGPAPAAPANGKSQVSSTKSTGTSGFTGGAFYQ